VGDDLESRVLELERKVAALEKRRPARRQGAFPIPPALAAVPGFVVLWEKRLAALPKQKRPTPEAQEVQLQEAAKILFTRGGRALLDAVEMAIGQGWQGFRASWTEERRNGSGATMRHDHAALGPDYGNHNARQARRDEADRLAAEYLEREVPR
jgi:hypothetical protein